jgi:methylated-DNA-protein-cysteine methyltransferase related protein
MSELKHAVYELVGSIPIGRVMTYGQIAALCGHPRAARQVGQIAHWGPSALPWHRVVNKKGRLAGAFTTGGREGQAILLRGENILVSPEYHLDIDRLIWWPDE